MRKLELSLLKEMKGMRVMITESRSYLYMFATMMFSLVALDACDQTWWYFQ